jgi:acetolactate synthase I/II/III large subunit
MRHAGLATVTAGGAIFPRLKALGVDVVFANAGTDFPPIIEGLAEAAARGIDLPRALAIPHEHAAMGMAHGYYLMTGRAQAVMLHTNVGLANGAIGAINAACEHIPMLLMSGRTPATEGGRFGARTVPIGWGQEMRDQAALVREACKWDYELRFPEQVHDILDRAAAIATSTPKGPVYLALPREVLCEAVDAARPRRPAAHRARPRRARPRGGGDRRALARRGRAPPRHRPARRGRRRHLRGLRRLGRALGHRRLLLVGLAPRDLDRASLPHRLGPRPLARRGGRRRGARRPRALVARPPPARRGRAGDPDRPRPDLQPLPGAQLPLRPLARRRDRAHPARALRRDGGLPRDEDRLAARRARIAAAASATRRRVRAEAAARNAQGITKEWASLCLGEALRGLPSTVFSELGTQLGVLERTEHRSWFQEPHSGGLGWSLPAALGAQLAEPGRLVVAAMGDGSYMFANPTVCHQIAEALGAPGPRHRAQQRRMGRGAPVGRRPLPRRPRRAREPHAAHRARPLPRLHPHRAREPRLGRPRRRRRRRSAGSTRRSDPGGHFRRSGARRSSRSRRCRDAAPALVGAESRQPSCKNRRPSTRPPPPRRERREPGRVGAGAEPAHPPMHRGDGAGEAASSPSSSSIAALSRISSARRVPWVSVRSNW